MKWQIEYYSPKLEEEILSLPDGLLDRYSLKLAKTRMSEVAKDGTF